MDSRKTSASDVNWRNHTTPSRHIRAPLELDEATIPTFAPTCDISQGEEEELLVLVDIHNDDDDDDVMDDGDDISAAEFTEA